MRLWRWEITVRVRRQYGICRWSNTILSEYERRKVVFGGTKHEPWPNYLSKCPSCGLIAVEINELDDRDGPGREGIGRLLVGEHTIPVRRKIAPRKEVSPNG